MTLAAGERRHRITLQRLTQATDPDYGGPVGSPAWTDIITVWAKRTNLLRGVGEALVAGLVVAPRRVRFDVAARAVDEAWRIVGKGGDHDGVIYDIKTVADSNDRSETAIMVESGANHG